MRLDANESPVGFVVPRDVLNVRTNRYPDPATMELRGLMGRRLGKDPEYICVGNGSDELIYYLIIAMGGPVLIPVPTFSMYGIIATALGQETITVPLDADLDLDIYAMIKACKGRSPRLVFLSAPNNPTGNTFSHEKIMKLIRELDCIIVIDEAYQPFSGKPSFIPLIDIFDRFIVLRTLSKVGMAGLRLGFMIAHPELIHEINKVRLPFNINSLSLEAAIGILERPGEIDAVVGEIVRQRGRLFTKMSKIEGIRPYPSDANFIFFKVRDAASVHRKLIEGDVLVRYIDEESLRVTVGAQKDNDKFIRVLAKVVGV